MTWSYLVPLSDAIMTLEKLLVAGDSVLAVNPAVSNLVSIWLQSFSNDTDAAQTRDQLTYPGILKDFNNLWTGERED